MARSAYQKSVALEAENARLTHELANAHGVAQACERRAEAAEAERDKLRVDAERYRWLRKAEPLQIPHGKGRLVLLGFDALDAAIDAALARKE